MVDTDDLIAGIRNRCISASPKSNNLPGARTVRAILAGVDRELAQLEAAIAEKNEHISQLQIAYEQAMARERQLMMGNDNG